MIKHVVMWKFKESAQGESKSTNLRLFKSQLEALVAIIPQIIELEVGINQFESATSYDIILISTFANKEDLMIYAKHPNHLSVADFCAKVRESRVVVDYEVGV